MKISELSELERPYEKLEKYGVEYLSNAELLAIILKSGTRKYSSIDLANMVLKKSENKIRNVFFNNIDLLEDIKGIGKVKKIQIMAISEIIKRVEKPIINEEIIIQNSEDVVNIIMPELRYLTKEEIRIIFLDTKGKIKKIKGYSSEGINNVELDPKIILKEAVKNDIYRIILVHNHPSGNPEPSISDIKYTEELIKYGSYLDIEVLDHIIIGDGTYQSIMNYIDN